MKFAAYSNLLIAAAAFFHTLTTYFLFELPPDFIVSLFVGCSTLFLYNFLRVIKLKAIPSENHSEQLRWASKNIKWITFITLGSCCACVPLFFFLSTYQMIIVLSMGLIGLSYNLSFGKSGITMRKIPFMKGIWISLVWTAVTLFLPLSVNGFYFDLPVFILRFLFIFTLIIPFDIRDLKYDEANMKTMPQLLGIKGAVFLGWILLLTCMCVAYDIFGSHTALLLSISYLITGIVLLLSIKERREIFYPLVVDGMIILQGLLFVVTG